MTATSSELLRPSCVLRKAQLRLLACGSLRRRLCPLFRNEGYLSFRGEPRFQLPYRPLCRTCGHSISYANRLSFWLPFHPPKNMLRRAIRCPRRETTMRQQRFALSAKFAAVILRTRGTYSPRAHQLPCSE